jgi:PAS domain S-box-containing protein
LQKKVLRPVFFSRFPMKNTSDSRDPWSSLREQLIGLGESSGRKSYYPELQKRLNQLERFRGLLDLTTDIILVVDLSSYRIVDANASACRQIGYPASEIIHMPLEQVIDLERLSWPEDDSRFPDGTMVTTSLRRNDGTGMPVEISLVMDMFEGEPYVVAVARNIADRLKAETALRESREHFRSMFESAAVGMVLLAPDGRLLQVNPAFCRFLGYAEEELLQLSPFDITHPEELGGTVRRLEEAWAGSRQVFDYEKRYLRKDGSVVWGRVTATWVQDSNRKSSHCVALIQDITERRRAEEALKRSETEKALILESTEELIVYHDRDMKILWANQASGRSVGLPPESLKSAHCWDLWHQRSFPCVNCPVLRALKSGRTEKGEVTSPDGRVWFIRGYPVRNEAGDLEGVVEFCLDITERKRAEEALRDSDRMKTEFISTAAHELRTPLTAIQGFSQLLLTEPGLNPEEQREFLSHINRKAVALADLVAELLDIARFEAGGSLPLKKVRCTAGDLVGFVGPFLEAQTLRNRLTLSLEDEAATLKADREKMGRVFENLISNAVKYSEEGSPIRIGGKRLEESYEFVISDQGIGMTPGQVAKVFDKFFRADSSNTAIGGIGLGMSIVKNIIEAHGGTIQVESAPGEGTTVRFTIPLLQGAKVGSHPEAMEEKG